MASRRDKGLKAKATNPDHGWFQHPQNTLTKMGNEAIKLPWWVILRRRSRAVLVSCNDYVEKRTDHSVLGNGPRHAN